MTDRVTSAIRKLPGLACWPLLRVWELRPANAPTAIDRFMRRIGFAFVLSGIVAALVVASTLQRIDKSEHSACHRVQLLREVVNRGSAIEVLTSREDTEAIRIAAMVIRGNARLLGRDGTSRAQIQRLRASIRRLRRYAALPSYQPPTDCDRAVNHPDTYRRPPPQPFTEALLKKALTARGR
jgi:hypothetical protein